MPTEIDDQVPNLNCIQVSIEDLSIGHREKVLLHELGQWTFDVSSTSFRGMRYYIYMIST